MSVIIAAWPQALEALADGLSQQNLGTCLGMLRTGGDVGMCLHALAGLGVEGLLFSSCSSEKWVLWWGFAHPLPLKSDLKLLLVVVVFPLPCSRLLHELLVCCCWFWI